MRAIQFLTPHHDNIGDNAQAFCIYNMLSTFFGEEKVLKFMLPNTDEGIKQVTKDDIIFLGSGGYLGDLWLRGELLRREIIEKCKDNLIVSFPQTIAFYNSKEANKSSEIYKSHPRLYLSARDPESYLLAKALFPNNHVFQLPDPVFTLAHNRNYKREGIICIFRNDKENWLREQKKDIIESCKTTNSRVDIIDTEGQDDNNRAPIENIKERLPKFLDSISKYQLVITDRFHGTVFAGITGTPCVAFPTINHKIVSSTYWYKYLGIDTYICKGVLSLSKYLMNIPKPFIYNPSKAIGLYHQTISSVITTGVVPNLNETKEVISFRRTIRKWRPISIPDSVLKDIVQAGIDAPCGSNAQCTRFKIIKDKTILNTISNRHRYNTNPPAVVIFVGYDFDVEHTINYHHRNPAWQMLRYQDIAASIQNMLLYCESIGLSCCWLSYLQDESQEFLQSISVKNPEVNIEYLSAIAIGMAESDCCETTHSGFEIKRKQQDYYIR